MLLNDCFCQLSLNPPNFFLVDVCNVFPAATPLWGDGAVGSLQLRCTQQRCPAFHPPVTFFPAGVRNAHSGTCQIKLSPAVSEERKQFASPEHVWADGRWALPSWEGKRLFPEVSSAWACKKSWGKKAELCLPSPFPAALRKEGNRCHPFETSMSVTTTAWTKPDVISRAVKPDNSQTALRAVQCSLRFPSHLLHFLKWIPQAHNSEFS